MTANNEPGGGWDQEREIARRSPQPVILTDPTAIASEYAQRHGWYVTNGVLTVPLDALGQLVLGRRPTPEPPCRCGQPRTAPDHDLERILDGGTQPFSVHVFAAAPPSSDAGSPIDMERDNA